MYKFDILANQILEQELIDPSIFGNESEDYRLKRPGLYGAKTFDASWEEQYKHLTRDTWLGFIVWNIIQAVDTSQITSLPDVAIAVSDFNQDRSLVNAAWLCVEILFLVIGSAPGLEFLKNSFRKAVKTPEMIGAFFKAEVLPRKREILGALNAIPGGAAILVTVKDAFSILESETASVEEPKEI